MIRLAGIWEADMATSSPVTRRNFLKQTAAGAAAVSAISGAPAILAQRNPMDVIGVACIGVGTKGYRPCWNGFAGRYTERRSRRR